MAEQQELEMLKAAYAAWGEKGWHALDTWREMMDDNFTIVSIDERTPGLSFASERNSREEALIYLSGIFEEWDMVHYTPRHYVCDGDRIAMFGTCAYRNKQTGKIAECRIACLWRFENGKAVEFEEVFDTARAAVAAMPG